MIFVFGSNLSGIHGAGAALFAKKYHGAIQGIGNGFQGDSYAIPTKGRRIEYIPLDQVKPYITQFIKFAFDNTDKGFKVTRIGCGLAGFDDEEIAPLFSLAPSNCFFDTEWKEYLGANREYWGSFA